MVSVRWFVAGLVACTAAVEVARTAESGNIAKPTAETATSLRRLGPDGLAQALQTHDRLCEQQNQLKQQASKLIGDNDGQKETISRLEHQIASLQERIDAWTAAIEQIGSQRGCTVSRLYWYTDLAEAKAAAKRTGRPILSLRMLGKLTDEYSCANSRFFRTALYSNKQVSDFLRTNFVLHWQSVRSVPHVTIDFGDGRKLERTLTGNSAHYVLSSDGTVLDVLPGLYSPLAFQQWLWDLRTLQLAYDKVSASERPARLREFHSHERDELLRRWDVDIQRLGETSTELVRTRITGARECAIGGAASAGRSGAERP